MNKEKVIAIFDIGKTNKKIFLFDKNLNIVFQQEKKFEPTYDSDGFECEDIDRITIWIEKCLTALVTDNFYDIKGVNFTTYGATLVFLSSKGERLTPIYNYLKKIPENIQKALFQKYGGEVEFCRKTASPVLGLLLNSGIQILWMKEQCPEIYEKTKSILHLPQYLSYLFTGQITSEYTSIGCHTFLWDFDQNTYHQWLADENISLPKPLKNSTSYNIVVAGKYLAAGIGIHDSSASLVPYIKGSKDNFILISTGTWCINMNPFNHSPLTEYQLRNDCLNYLSEDKQSVKSSRLFLGHLHDVNVRRIAAWFNMENEINYKLEIDEYLIKRFLSNKNQERIFFQSGIPSGFIDVSVDLSQFRDYSEAYHRLMYDLTRLNEQSINMISSNNDNVSILFVSGGFARNEIFVRLLATFFYDKNVFTSVVDNASALGASLVIWEVMEEEYEPNINLNLHKWIPF